MQNNELLMAQHQEDLIRMDLLRIRKAMIQAFKEDGNIHICTRPDGEFVVPTEDEIAAISTFEEKTGLVVYMVLRAVTLYGTLDSYLCVEPNPELWEVARGNLKEGYTDTYTVNRQNPSCSEPGFISFKHTKSKGLVRTDIDFF